MTTYSSLPNRRVARNKLGGGKDEPFLISVAPGICMVARNIKIKKIVQDNKIMSLT